MTTGQDQPTESALHGLQVLDLSTSVAAAWCSRLFADFGADVALVEPLGGHPLRAHAPATEDGRGIPAEHLLANKRSLVLDLEAESGRELLRDLVTHADVLIESFAPGVLAGWGLDAETLEAIRPGLVVVSVTAHGQDGAYAALPGNDLTSSARSGWASINGFAAQPPLQATQYQGSYCTGVLAYAAAVAALHHRAVTADSGGPERPSPGDGQHLDISEFEVMASTFAPALLRAQYAGEVGARKETMDVTGGPVPVADGFFALTLSRAHFYRDAMSVLGLDDLADDEQLQEGWYRNEHRELWVDRVHTAMAGWSRRDLFDELGVRRVVAGPVFAMNELTDNEHLRARGFWVRADDDPEGPEHTGAPVKLSATPWRLRTRAPRPGEHTLALLGEYDVEEERVQTLLAAGVLVAEATPVTPGAPSMQRAPGAMR
ncbi:MAG: CoA transferase [Chloroflexi bacterium]|nr:CoA transferase [Chloroflexota bacterium]MDA1145772.1 CoA transferase [Chloroflexota bacterium]